MIKLYLITGFLGAGKTTFLKNFIKMFSDHRLQIIVNEFGKEGVDGQLLKDVGASLNEINNGSIFCSCRLDRFEEVLVKAIEDKPGMIVIEASGLSDPTNIKKILGQKDKFSDIEYMGSICLVDARQFPKVYQTATVVKKQIAVSDIILLNKTDLADRDRIREIYEIIGNHRPDIPIFETEYGEIKKEWMDQIRTISGASEKAEMQQRDITLRSYVIEINPSFTLYNFQKFIEMFIEDTYRIKGFVNLEGRIYLVDCVGNMFKAEPYEGEASSVNKVVVLSGSGLPTRKSIKEAIKWYPEDIKEFC
ncbi:CobW family GTP-binding protein [Anaerobium acetethylicum]|uniref:GTPase, G3E family n=1 Tax=Anaerobium acetethylicum TaxID=1619234 RepID=A0A1D3TVG7_9FIRM|nr:CobW family GTP-binding protein [Anaerobium acetethylicum]SCP98126.1 GTPase, G3E family [Anaerobium acetethylicum]